MATMVGTIFILVIASVFLYLLLTWLKTKSHQQLPIDNKRRPFSFDEKAKVIEKSVLSHGYAMCEKCGAREDLSIDHITPIELGGHNGLDNLQLLCQKCNSRKRDRYVG